jgi:hypothetical protein
MRTTDKYCSSRFPLGFPRTHNIHSTAQQHTGTQTFLNEFDRDRITKEYSSSLSYIFNMKDWKLFLSHSPLIGTKNVCVTLLLFIRFVKNCFALRRTFFRLVTSKALHQLTRHTTNMCMAQRTLTHSLFFRSSARCVWLAHSLSMYG